MTKPSIGDLIKVKHVVFWETNYITRIPTAEECPGSLLIINTIQEVVETEPKHVRVKTDNGIWDLPFEAVELMFST